jgi:hypothetical protein
LPESLSHRIWLEPDWLADWLCRLLLLALELARLLCSTSPLLPLLAARIGTLTLGWAARVVAFASWRAAWDWVMLLAEAPEGPNAKQVAAAAKAAMIERLKRFLLLD